MGVPLLGGGGRWLYEQKLLKIWDLGRGKSYLGAVA
jgi:hypothetical protein